MKFIITLILAFLPLISWGQAGKKGLGIMLGNPTGLSGKYWLKENHAIDGGLAWSLGKHTNASLHSDYLLHQKGALIFQDQYHLDLYYGVGGRMEFANDIELGVRVPVGVVYNLDKNNADLFLEVAPIWDFISRVGLELHFALGARYYF